MNIFLKSFSLQFILHHCWGTSTLSIVEVVAIWLACYCRPVLKISSSNFFKIKKKKCLTLLLSACYFYSLFKNVNLNFLGNLLCRNLSTSVWKLVFLSSRLAFRSSECKILAFPEALCLNRCKTKWWGYQDCFSSVFLWQAVENLDVLFF